MNLIPNYVKLLIVVSALFSAVYGTYKWGYSSAEQKYASIIQEQKTKIEQLSKREVIIEKEIVTEYVDRVRTVKEIQTKIVEVTRDVLREESTKCDIGPNFIGLHNSSASNQALPTGTPGTDGITKTIDFVAE